LAIIAGLIFGKTSVLVFGGVKGFIIMLLGDNDELTVFVWGIIAAVLTVTLGVVVEADAFWFLMGGITVWALVIMVVIMGV
jgi:hypothetical protein